MNLQEFKQKLDELSNKDGLNGVLEETEIDFSNIDISFLSQLYEQKVNPDEIKDPNLKKTYSLYLDSLLHRKKIDKTKRFNYNLLGDIDEELTVLLDIEKKSESRTKGNIERLYGGLIKRVRPIVSRIEILPRFMRNLVGNISGINYKKLYNELYCLEWNYAFLLKDVGKNEMGYPEKLKSAESERQQLEGEINQEASFDMVQYMEQFIEGRQTTR